MKSTSFFRRPSSCEVWTLRRGTGSVILQPSRHRVAWVVGGTLFRPGDGVELPEGLSWGDAIRPREDGGTAFSPYELRLAFDSFTRSWKLGPPPDGLPEQEAMERDQLAREVSRFLEDEADHDPLPEDP